MTVKTPAPERQGSRRRLAKQGNALPDGSYPIPNASYLKKAIRAVGRAGPGKRPALGRLIRKRARQLGAWGVVKGSWADNTGGAKAMAQALHEALELSRADGTLWELHHRTIDLVGPKGYIHGWIYVGGGKKLKKPKLGDEVRVSSMGGPIEGQVIHHAPGGEMHIRTPKGARHETHAGMITHMRSPAGAETPGRGPTPEKELKKGTKDAGGGTAGYEHPLSPEDAAATLRMYHSGSIGPRDEYGRPTTNRSALKRLEALAARAGYQKDRPKARVEAKVVAGGGKKFPTLATHRRTQAAQRSIEESKRARGVKEGTPGVPKLSSRQHASSTRSALRRAGFAKSEKVTGTSIRSEATGSRLSEYTHGHVVDEHPSGYAAVYMSGGRDKPGGGRIRDAGTLSERQAALNAAGFKTKRMPEKPGYPEHILVQRPVAPLKNPPRKSAEEILGGPSRPESEFGKPLTKEILKSRQAAPLKEKAARAAAPSPQTTQGGKGSGGEAAIKAAEPRPLRIAGKRMTKGQSAQFHALSPASQDIYEERRQEGLGHAEAMQGLPSASGEGVRGTRGSSASRAAATTFAPGEASNVLSKARAKAKADRIAAERSPETAMHTHAAAKEPVTSHTAHAELLKARTAARKAYPKGHPERLKAERAVRHSRKSRRAGEGSGGGGTTGVTGTSTATRRRQRKAVPAGKTSAPDTGKSIMEHRAEVGTLAAHRVRAYYTARRQGIGHERAMTVARETPEPPKGSDAARRYRKTGERKAPAKATAPVTAPAATAPGTATPGEQALAKKYGVSVAQIRNIKQMAKALQARGWSQTEARKIAIARVTKGTPIPQFAPGKKGPRER